LAAAAADAKLKAVVVPPFSIATEVLPDVEEHLPLSQYKQIAFTTPVGKVSSFIPVADGGVVIHVQQKLPVDPARMQAGLPEFVKVLRQRKRQESISRWVQKEWDKSVRIPLSPPKQGQNPMASRGTGT
jgi:hypothetical protein